MGKPKTSAPTTSVSAQSGNNSARNNEKLLQAVADYRQYLQTLAGKLCHELKTPLAITRSSLENLASQELNAGSRRCRIHHQHTCSVARSKQ